MTGFLEDVRYSFRTIAKNRGFAAAAIVSLALGIGANTTIFTLVNAIFLRPLPAVTEPSRLSALYTVDSQTPGFLLSSYPNYTDYRDRNSVFSSLLLYASISLNLTGQGAPQMISGQMVTGNYFGTLGVTPAIGRTFLPEEDRTPDTHQVAVISLRFWKRQFAADRLVTSRALRLNGRPFRIIGVAPEGFEGLNTLTATDIWVPFMMYRAVYPNTNWVNQRRALVFPVVGRLKPEVTLQQAEAAMQVLAEGLEREHPKDNHGRRVKLTSVAEAAIPPRNRPAITGASAVLMIISALVLLIASANVANLLLARAAGRSKEITVRLALGASRWRLVRQLLCESVWLSLAGGVVGLVVARWARDLMWSMRPPMFDYAALHLDLNTRVLVYTSVVSLGTGVLFGLVPALRATRAELATDLKERTARQSSNPGSRRLRSLLVTAQVALSVVALVGAGLFVRSLRNATDFNPGFDTTHTGVILFNTGEQGYGEERGRAFQRAALERASAIPGVLSASAAMDWPFHVSLARTVLLGGGESLAEAGRRSLMGIVWPGYFRTMTIPLLQGRDFNYLDSPDRPRVAVVNQTAAAQFWPGQNPIGKRVRFHGESALVEIVGQVRNASYLDIGEEPQPMIYVSLIQYHYPTAAVHVRVQGPPGPVLQQVGRAVQALDPDLLLQVETTSGILQEALWAQRLSAGLLAAFGALALTLATIGIYGVISYSVNLRVREIGVRMALGATAGDVQMMVLREGIRLVAIGVAVGTVLALGGSRLVESLLLVTGPRDAFTFTFVPAVLTLVAVFACWLPALRATRVDPCEALRDE